MKTEQNYNCSGIFYMILKEKLYQARRLYKKIEISVQHKIIKNKLYQLYANRNLTMFYDWTTIAQYVPVTLIGLTALYWAIATLYYYYQDKKTCLIEQSIKSVENISERFSQEIKSSYEKEQAQEKKRKTNVITQDELDSASVILIALYNITIQINDTKVIIQPKSTGIEVISSNIKFFRYLNMMFSVCNSQITIENKENQIRVYIIQSKLDTIQILSIR